MRQDRRLIWIPLAIAAALAAASVAIPAHAQSMGNPPHPAPYDYFGPDPLLGPGFAQEPGRCYYDNLRGRVCLD